jgi:hypothetical protein
MAGAMSCHFERQFLFIGYSYNSITQKQASRSNMQDCDSLMNEGSLAHHSSAGKLGALMCRRRDQPLRRSMVMQHKDGRDQ